MFTCVECNSSRNEDGINQMLKSVPKDQCDMNDFAIWNLTDLYNAGVPVNTINNIISTLKEQSKNKPDIKPDWIINIEK